MKHLEFTVHLSEDDWESKIKAITFMAQNMPGAFNVMLISSKFHPETIIRRQKARNMLANIQGTKKMVFYGVAEMLGWPIPRWSWLINFLVDHCGARCYHNGRIYFQIDKSG